MGEAMFWGRIRCEINYKVIKIKTNNKGFTLVELIIVIALVAVLMVIVAPNFASIAAKSKEQVCNINCSQLERTYNVYLTIEDLLGTENIFEQYIQSYGKNICPSGGIISFRNGKVKCSIHSKEEEGDDGEDDVPYL